jgi:hypothetical protein
VNKNLVTIGCTEAEKVRFAAHLLEAPATSWWENYQITHPIEEVNWDMFQEAFRIAHISSGVMSLKKKEFRNFRQGHRTVAEYIDEFNKLARYAPDDVDTDAKRRERYLDGLNDELVVQLSMVYAPNYQALIDKATILENKQNRMESRKRKFHNHGNFNSGPLQKTHHTHDGSGSSGFNKHGNHNHHSHGRNGHNHHGNGHKHHNGSHNHGGSNGHGNGSNNGRNRNNNFTMRDIRQVQCFNYKKLGHYANDCPEAKKDNGNTNGSKPNPFQKGHVNHLDVEEIMDEPDAVIGKFPINTCPALVLFDTGASHSFISRAFVDEHKLPIESMRTPLRVNSPGEN